MKTLIYGTYYPTTPDTEVIYLNSQVIIITDDGFGNWGICCDNQFIHLHTFQVDQAIWYFTNDFQEIQIRELASKIQSVYGLDTDAVEWFKTVALSDHLYNHEYIAYFKLRGLESYHALGYRSGDEHELIGLLLGHHTSEP